jgi:predicted DNA-binding transcriptional regulator
MTALQLTNVREEYVVESKDAVIYIVLGSTFAVIFVSLILLAVKGRRVDVEPPEAKALPIPTKMREGKNTGARSAASLVEDLQLSGTTQGVLGSHKKNENWTMETSLVGSTLRMYWSFLCRRHSSVGLRSIQRELGFSSPSSAVYQLEKLMNLGLLRKDDMGDYTVRKVVKVGLLRDFVFIRGYPLPKSALSGALILLVDVICFAALISMQIQIMVSVLAIMPGLISSSVFWYDGLKAFGYKQRLIGRNANP